ncbi:caspase domain-containing protein [Armillaria luteobubalina]|uniref:Caspase domain-containing protein n=1 Tax=Armillaria luteobubalina TaxID=153913 RepID=A0AA39Q1N9_9AGAR|nr:caspase domain-containing protein [Armillaria luteobubalina]
MLPTYHAPSAGPREQYQPPHCHMARAFADFTGVPVTVGDVILSESESISREMRPLEEFESMVAEQMGMSRAVDEATVLLEAKALRKAEYLPKLGRLHRLRHQYGCARERLQAKLEVCPSLPGSPYPVDGSRFYAVLIGINEYASYPLQGCVSDAKLMEKYLTEDLGVPRNRIQLLAGSTELTSPADSMNPSRAHIIHTLLSIIDNSEILHGDNIIIYYSGHGSCYPFEGEDGETEYIEAICPIDRDIVGDDGKPVPDISDRELNTVLGQISRVKGHRITVILDCCHAGGVSRGLPESGARRSPPTQQATLEDMLIAGDKIPRGYPDYQSIISEDWCPDMSFHVVLAACKDWQFAKAKEVKREDGTEGHIGIFTDSLVRALRSGYYTRETKYTNLVHYLDQTPDQKPVVAGEHRNARIWYQE